MEFIEDYGKRVIVVLVVLPLAIFIIFMIFELNSERIGVQEPLKIGEEVPDFTFKNMNGENISLRGLRGKVVFVNVWATWCPTCTMEMASMQRLYDSFKEKNFEMLAVSIDILGKDTVEPYIKKHNLNFPVLLDEKGKIKKIFSTTGVPETFIIDKQGILRIKEIGPRNWDDRKFAEMIEKLVES